jgi:CMP-N-acetylneuraminic acid synthetase
MKIVALIPFWDKYRYENPELDGLDIMNLAGKALINYPIELANRATLISETYIYSNNENIIDVIDERLSFNFLPRNAYLDTQDASIEDIIRNFLDQIDADVIVLLHPKSPFISMNSLSECLDKILNNEYDSAFIARVERKFAWLAGRRVNYQTANGTPHLGSIEPVTLETSSMYIFTRGCFEKTGTRIGNRPFIKAVNNFEGLVISEADDIKLAEFLLDSQFYIGRQ